MVKNGLNGIGGLALTPRAPLQVTFRLPIAHPTVGTEEPALLPSLGSPESDTTERLSTILHQGTQLRCPSGHLCFINQIYGVSRQPKASEILELTHLVSSSRHKSSWDGQLFPSSELVLSTWKYV